MKKHNEPIVYAAGTGEFATEAPMAGEKKPLWREAVSAKQSKQGMASR